MTRQLMTVLLLGLTSVMLTGCAGLPGFLADARQKVEVLIGEQGAGTYTITAEKDGKVILKQSMRCDAGPDGKLAGCHPL